MVIFRISDSLYCYKMCTFTIGAAIFSKEKKTWKLDIANKKLAIISDNFFSSLRFKQLWKDGIAAIVEEVNPSIEMILDKPLYAYTTMATIIGIANNELHELLSLVTAEDYFRPDSVPYKWASDIKCPDESDHLYDIAIHSYGINGTGRYFERTRGYARYEGALKEVWRDNEK